jgi:hypothetical protein
MQNNIIGESHAIASRFAGFATAAEKARRIDDAFFFEADTGNLAGFAAPEWREALPRSIQ